MIGGKRETHVLDLVKPQLEAEGFDVYFHPLPATLPKFMLGYVPDLIGIGASKNVAVEVVTTSNKAVDHLGAVAERFEGNADWDFRVVYMRPASEQLSLAAPSLEGLDGALGDIETLLSEGRTTPALLMVWAALEATGRALLPQRLARPQPGAQLVEALASEGWINPGEADHLRDLIQLRNALAHGDFDANATTDQVRSVLDLVRHLRGEKAAEAA